MPRAGSRPTPRSVSSAARAEEILCLSVEELFPADMRGRVVSKGGAIEWIHWQSGTTQLLPRLIAGRTHGPLFLTDRKAPARTPALDTCPATDRARLSCRRAEGIFEESTRLPANPLAFPDDVGNLEGWTLHRLHHGALTHDAEDGSSTPMPLARSRHAFVGDPPSGSLHRRTDAQTHRPRVGKAIGGHRGLAPPQDTCQPE
ncbi:site-specific integrase [Streptomyces kebangsaanensis]|uniref:Site-specific integrase n=1 Tax=Streptomyces kebangsaanensis TaxID=864058 RepID=A0ABW6L072_9ACTN